MRTVKADITAGIDIRVLDVGREALYCRCAFGIIIEIELEFDGGVLPVAVVGCDRHNKGVQIVAEYDVDLRVEDLVHVAFECAKFAQDSLGAFVL